MSGYSLLPRGGFANVSEKKGRTCSVSKCDEPLWKLGYCVRHYRENRGQVPGLPFGGDADEPEPVTPLLQPDSGRIEEDEPDMSDSRVTPIIASKFQQPLPRPSGQPLGRNSMGRGNGASATENNRSRTDTRRKPSTVVGGVILSTGRGGTRSPPRQLSTSGPAASSLSHFQTGTGSSPGALSPNQPRSPPSAASITLAGILAPPAIKPAPALSNSAPVARTHANPAYARGPPSAVPNSITPSLSRSGQTPPLWSSMGTTPEYGRSGSGAGNAVATRYTPRGGDLTSSVVSSAPSLTSGTARIAHPALTLSGSPTLVPSSLSRTSSLGTAAEHLITSLDQPIETLQHLLAEFQLGRQDLSLDAAMEACHNVLDSLKRVQEGPEYRAVQIKKGMSDNLWARRASTTSSAESEFFDYVIYEGGLLRSESSSDSEGASHPTQDTPTAQTYMKNIKSAMQFINRAQTAAKAAKKAIDKQQTKQSSLPTQQAGPPSPTASAAMVASNAPTSTTAATRHAKQKQKLSHAADYSHTWAGRVAGDAHAAFSASEPLPHGSLVSAAASTMTKSASDDETEAESGAEGRDFDRFARSKAGATRALNEKLNPANPLAKKRNKSKIKISRKRNAQPPPLTDPLESPISGTETESDLDSITARRVKQWGLKHAPAKHSTEGFSPASAPAPGGAIALVPFATSGALTGSEGVVLSATVPSTFPGSIGASTAASTSASSTASATLPPFTAVSPVSLVSSGQLAGSVSSTQSSQGRGSASDSSSDSETSAVFVHRTATGSTFTAGATFSAASNALATTHSTSSSVHHGAHQLHHLVHAGTVDLSTPFISLKITVLQDPVQKILSSVNDWLEFDVFQLYLVTGPKTLSVLCLYLFMQLDVFEQFNVNEQTFVSFITGIEKGYYSNPYHNNIHAADVVQNMHHFLTCESMTARITALDVLAGLVAAAIHDYKHPGTTNAFQVATQSRLALRYNDTAVLENMHCADAFRLLRKPENDIFAQRTKDEQKEIRESIVHMVFATDMSKHFAMLAELHANIETKKSKNTWYEVNNRKDRLALLDIAMHCADLGNPCKSRVIYDRWVQRITQEFFEQGDQERQLGLPISPMCDRTKPNPEKSQMGFIDYLVQPLYLTFLELCPEVQACLTQLGENRKFWADRLAAQEAEEAAALALRNAPPSVKLATPPQSPKGGKRSGTFSPPLSPSLLLRSQSIMEGDEEADTSTSKTTSPEQNGAGPARKKRPSKSWGGPNGLLGSSASSSSTASSSTLSSSSSMSKSTPSSTASAPVTTSADSVPPSSTPAAPAPVPSPRSIAAKQGKSPRGSGSGSGTQPNRARPKTPPAPAAAAAPVISATPASRSRLLLPRSASRERGIGSSATLGASSFPSYHGSGGAAGHGGQRHSMIDIPSSSSTSSSLVSSTAPTSSTSNSLTVPKSAHSSSIQGSPASSNASTPMGSPDQHGHSLTSVVAPPPVVFHAPPVNPPYPNKPALSPGPSRRKRDSIVRFMDGSEPTDLTAPLSATTASSLPSNRPTSNHPTEASTLTTSASSAFSTPASLSVVTTDQASQPAGSAAPSTLTTPTARQPVSYKEALTSPMSSPSAHSYHARSAGASPATSPMPPLMRVVSTASSGGGSGTRTRTPSPQLARASSKGGSTESTPKKSKKGSKKRPKPVKVSSRRTETAATSANSLTASAPSAQSMSSSSASALSSTAPGNLESQSSSLNWARRVSASVVQAVAVKRSSNTTAESTTPRRSDGTESESSDAELGDKEPAEFGSPFTPRNKARLQEFTRGIMAMGGRDRRGGGQPRAAAGVGRNSDNRQKEPRSVNNYGRGRGSGSKRRGTDSGNAGESARSSGSGDSEEHDRSVTQIPSGAKPKTYDGKPPPHPQAHVPPLMGSIDEDKRSENGGSDGGETDVDAGFVEVKKRKQQRISGNRAKWSSVLKTNNTTSLKKTSTPDGDEYEI